MKRLAIQNKLGQTARLVDWHSPQIIIVFRRDTHRVELCHEIQTLIENKIPFEIINEISLSQIEKQEVAIPGFGILRLNKENSPLSPSLQYINDDTSQLKPLTKWVAAIHVGVIAFIIAFSWLFKPKAPEQQVVYISEDLTKIVQPKETVNMREEKFQRQEVVEQKVSNKTTQGRKSLAQKTAKSNKRAKLERTLEVSKMSAAGALGALGGTPFGSKKSSGLDLAAKNISKGTSGGAGLGGIGGMDVASPGRGVVGSAIGAGGRAQGAGGYGTRGKAGTGQTGYGEFSFAGSSGGYSIPMEEEALIEGGLDRDQISAVIQKNLGQIIYCYEKGLQLKPNLSGRVSVNFVIGGQGFVRQANVADTSLRHAQVESCILDKLKSWKFPKPHGRVDVRVSYPFVLKRVHQG